ncbi:hypothetical protein [Psychroflexus torquis]|uniref:hypothetical protein n=1 Tax=Psychroflexus torquis TaxID=57029 RepID=UPI0000D5322F|nr:hypothetical protein [Psychroflexus torquis]
MINPPQNPIYTNIFRSIQNGNHLFNVLIDPDKFNLSQTQGFLNRTPTDANFSGSTIKLNLLYRVNKFNLLSGQNPKYLIDLNKV